MFLLDLTRRSARSLLSAKTRTILTVFAIAVGAFALTLTLGASNGAHSYANAIIRNNFDPTQLIVSGDETLFSNTDITKPQKYNPNFSSITNGAGASEQIKTLTDSDLARLKDVPGVASVRPSIDLSLQYITRDGQKKYVGVVRAFNSYRKPDLLAGTIPSNLGSKSVIIPEAFLQPLGFSSAKSAIGKPIRLAVKKQTNQASLVDSFLSGDTAALTSALSSTDVTEEQFTVVAVTAKPSTFVQPGTSLYLYSSEAAVNTLNDIASKGSANYHRFFSAYVTVTDGTDVSKLHATQARIKKLGYGAQSVIDTEKTITQVINVLQGIVTVFGLIAIVASVFGVVNTMYISVLQRTREIGLMKALGMHKKDINKLFLFEAALIGALGGIVGSVGAAALGTALNPLISKQLTLGSVHLLQFKLLQMVALILVLMVVAIVAGLLPARKAAHLDPIEALRTE